jgi:hypothetical protein
MDKQREDGDLRILIFLNEVYKYLIFFSEVNGSKISLYQVCAVLRLIT